MPDRWVEVHYPELKITLTAWLWVEMNPELCELFWNNLPIESVQSHTMSTGQGMYMPHRVVKLVKTNTILITELPVGTLTFSTVDYKSITCFYGKVSEPLPVSPVARIREEDLEDLRRVGEAAWNANYFTHLPLRVIVRRKG